MKNSILVFILVILIVFMASSLVSAQDRGRSGVTGTISLNGSFNLENVTANRLIDISESPPSKDDCKSRRDLGKIVLHSKGDQGAIYFCVQGKAPNYDNARWFVLKTSEGLK